MIPSMNPKEMARMLKQFGIKTEEIKAKKVLIETEDSEITIENPSVIAIEMEGQKSFQISGITAVKKAEEKKETEEDAKIVAEGTGVSVEDAKIALKETNGNIAEAILKLKKQ